MQKIVMFTDPNKDVDDLIAIIMLNNMKKANLLDIAGIVATHGNSETTYKRAVYTQAVCRTLGNDIEVCVGLPEVYEDKLSNVQVNRFCDSLGLDKIMESANRSKIRTNSEIYLKEIFEKAQPASLDMLVIAQMTDLWNFVLKHPALFCEKVKTVIIMAGTDYKAGEIVPDNSTNNANDFNASVNLYKFLKNKNISTKFINRVATMEVPVSIEFYKSFKQTNKLIGDFIYDAARQSIKEMYLRLYEGEGLSRQTPEWFYRTFTNIAEQDFEKYKKAGTDPAVVDEILSKLTKLNLYDPLTLIAATDKFKSLFKSEVIDNFEILMPKNHNAIYSHFYKLTQTVPTKTTKKLTVEKAIELIKNGPNGNQMPDAKIRHCLEIGRVARIIAQHCGFSSEECEEAEVLGIIHDIGSHWNRGYQHPYVGYQYILSLGYDEKYANICLTHSFIHGDPNCTADGLLVEDGKVNENNIIPWENEEDSQFVLNFLKTHKYTKLEDIINLCDLMVTDKIIGLDKRLVDLIATKGAFVTTQNHIKVARELQTQLEEEMNCSILDLFPEIISNQQNGDTYRPKM